jgi:uncharacterized protein (DUF58 family)
VSFDPRRHWRARYRRWLDARVPKARSLVLGQRHIFIFPSRAGLWFLLALAVMLVAAINYQNNLAFALVFFLFSLLVVAILHTYANLAGLGLESLRARPVYAGEMAEFELQLRRQGRRAHHAIELQWPGQPPALISLLAGATAPVKLFHASQRRGWLRPGRLRVQTRYPLGLLRAWSWIDLDTAALVYPLPVAGPRPLSGGAGDPRGEQRWRRGSEDFYGFRPYHSGDNPRHVLWRAYAKGLPLQSKQFVEQHSPSQWLAWEAVAGEREQRLGQLCYWVLELHRLGQPFGLKLPGQTLATGAGDEHRERALRMLALFGLQQQPLRAQQWQSLSGQPAGGQPHGPRPPTGSPRAQSPRRDSSSPNGGGASAGARRDG